MPFVTGSNTSLVSFLVAPLLLLLVFISNNNNTQIHSQSKIFGTLISSLSVRARPPDIVAPKGDSVHLQNSTHKHPRLKSPHIQLEVTYTPSKHLQSLEKKRQRKRSYFYYARKPNIQTMQIRGKENKSNTNKINAI